jgi:hypothetical protein
VRRPFGRGCGDPGDLGHKVSRKLPPVELRAGDPVSCCTHLGSTRRIGAEPEDLSYHGIRVAERDDDAGTRSPDEVPGLR